MIIKPRIKGFVCITAHPTGCMQNVIDQVEYARKHQVLAEGKPKRCSGPRFFDRIWTV